MSKVIFKTHDSVETIEGEARSGKGSSVDIIVYPCEEYPQGAEFSLPRRCIVGNIEIVKNPQHLVLTI